jgi:UDP-glucose 4-epimerase
MKQRMGCDADVVLLRPFNAFGPSQSTKAVIPELIVKGLRGEPIRTTAGEQTREFNFVSNLVDGMVLAAAHGAPIEGPINLAGGEEVEIRILVQRIHELTGRKSSIEIGALPYRPNEIWRMYGDSSRARQLLGWRPAVSLQAGLEQTVAWYRDHGWST